MVFRVGPWQYRVVITEGPIAAKDSADLVGQCDWSAREIRISGELPVMRRTEVLAHELRHAYVQHFGRPRAGEDDANSAASFALLLHRELNRQGGEAALQRMSAGTLFDAPRPDVQSELYDSAGQVSGAQCGVCLTSFSAGTIVTSTAEYDERLSRLVVRRALFCEHCSHVQSWTEGATNSGTPNGQVLAKPQFKRGAAVAEFLREHGTEVGVVIAL